MTGRRTSRPARVLFVDTALGDVGGSLVSLLTLVRHVDRLRFEPLVLLFDESLISRRLRDDGVQVFLWRGGAGFQEPDVVGLAGVARSAAGVTGARTLYTLGAGLYRLLSRDLPLALRFAGLVAEQRIDLVHANDRVRTNAFAVYGARLARVPVVVHERWIASYTWTDRLASRGVDALCCVSDAVRRGAVETGARPRSVSVIANATDFPPRGRELGDGRPTITFVGRLVPWKGPDHFLDACARLAPRYPEARFVVVGGGTEQAGGYADALRRQAEDAGIAGRTEFTGAIGDVGRILEQTDVLVHASVAPEPFGRTLIEGMAHGLPVVATRLGGPLEILEDRETGILVEPGSGEAIAAAVDWLLSHREQAREMGRRARDVARDRFSPVRHARAVAAVWERVLRQRRAA